MPTEAEEAFAEGFAALASVHGKTWTFGAATFVAVASVLKPDDPRLLGSSDRHFELQVSTAEMPSPRFTNGDELRQGSSFYRVARQPDADTATGITTTLVVLAGIAPAISTQPVSATVNDGATETFAVTASGLPAPSYQWKKDGVAIVGATGSAIVLDDIQTVDAGSYTVVVTNSFGSVTSAAAVLTVNPGS